MYKIFRCALFFLLLVSIQINAQSDSLIAALFDLSIEDLMNTKVNIASNSEETLSEASSIVTVITSKQFQDMGARDLRDVLRIVPGFQLGMRDMGYTSIGIRGISTPNSEKVMIMIDGSPVNENLEGSAAIVFADMVLDNVERIEIIRGPGSALYGAGAFLGVINIISKKSDISTDINTSVKFGSYNTWQANINGSKHIGKLKINSFADYINSKGPEKNVEIDALSGDPINGSVSLAGTDKGYTRLFREKTTLGLNVDYKGLYSKTLYINTEKGDYIGAASVLTENSKAHHSHIFQKAGYQKKLSDRFSFDLNAVYLLYNVDNLLNIYPNDYTDPVSNDIYTQGAYSRMGGKQQNININLLVEYKLNKNNSIQVGLSQAFIKYYDEIFQQNPPGSGVEGIVDVPSFFDDDELHRNITSIYIQDAWKIQKKLSLVAGLRVDKYSDVGVTVNPRAALVVNPITSLNLKFLYGSAFRAPTFAETYFNAAPILAGNKDIKSETIQTFETQISYRLSSNILISANYFHNAVRDLITILPDANLVIGRYGNSGDLVNVHGVETEIKIVQTGERYAFLAYSYQKGFYDKDNEPLSGMANHTIYAGINYNFFTNYNININANFVGKRQRSSVDKREDLNGYSLINLSLCRKNILKNLSVTASVYNLLNSDYRVPDTSALIYNDYPLEGINFMFGLGYKF